MKTYWVERVCPVRKKWIRMMGACGNKSYALGWLHALDSFYPHPDYRVVRAQGLDGEREVVEEAPARSAPHVNS